MTRRDHPSAENQLRSTDSHLTELEQTIYRLEAEVADLQWAQAEGEMLEACELIWTLLDGEITEPQLQRLEQLICEDSDARETYVQCIQMHADLMRLFAQNVASEAQPGPTAEQPENAPAAEPNQPLST